MSKIKIYLDTRRPLSDNTYPLKLSCNIQNKGKIMVSTNIYVRKECFINNTIINTSNAEIYNAILMKKYVKMETILNELRINDLLNSLTLADIKDRIKRELNDYEPKQRQNLFLPIANAFIETKKQFKTKQACEYMLTHLSKYADTKTLTFEDITQVFIANFERYLNNKNLSINTISIILRNLRSVFNYAINENQISADLYPFKKFKIKQEPTRKRSLSVEQVRQLINLRPETKEKEKVRDLFLLMIYLIGINATDLLNLKEVRNGRIEYRRAKTKKLYSIKVEPEALAIINKYKGKDYLLDITYRENFVNHFDKTLKKLGTITTEGVYHKQVITPIEPNLSSYYARHTWATLCSELDIPKEVIAKGLGHSSNSVTDIYINFNQKKVDKANRQVIDYILKDIH